MSKITDPRQLMIQVQSGDELAYAKLLEIISVLVRSFARGRLHRWRLSQEIDVEDIVQEVLMAVHLKKGTYDPSQALEPWIFAIANYKMVDVIRRHRFTTNLENIPDFADPHSAADSNETNETLQWGFLQLNHRERELLTSVKLNEKSIKEVALEMNLSESAVKVGVHRAMSKLKEIFKVPSHED